MRRESIDIPVRCVTETPCMRYLTVIRHAKSCWDHSGLADHDRSLGARWLLAAPAVGTFLKRTYFGGGDEAALLPQPDCLISSTAARALATAQIIRERLELTIDMLQLNSQLYMASEGTILKVVQDLNEDWKHVFLFGHNPGLHVFVDRMLARARISRMPTCTAVILGLPHQYWALSDWNEAQLIACITPKMLEKRFPEVWPGISRSDGDD